MSIISKIAIPGVADPYDIQAYKALSIPLGYVDTTSTATSFTATVSGITSLYDGLTIYLSNTTIAANGAWTLNINNLGAKPVYLNNGDTQRSYIDFNVNDTYLFIYNESQISGGCWNIILNNTPLIIDFTMIQLLWNICSPINSLNNSLTPVKLTATQMWNELELAQANKRPIYLRISDADNSNQKIILPFQAYINSIYYFSTTERFFGKDPTLTDAGLITLNAYIFRNDQSDVVAKLDIYNASTYVVPDYYDGTKLATIFGIDIYAPWTDGDTQAYGNIQR